MKRNDAYEHEYRTARSLYYKRIIRENIELSMDDPFNYDLDENIKELIKLNPEDKKLIKSCLAEIE